MDKELPRSLFGKCNFISKGATGWVFEAAPGIALKYVCTDRHDGLRLKEFGLENEIYDLIEQSNPPPYFIKSFLRLPYAHFMQQMPDCLDFRLRNNRRQDPKTAKCLEVLRLEPTPKIERWAAELSAALAWLEHLGLVHGDIRPANLLLDGNDHLKLVDFDCCAKIGDREPGMPPPWAPGTYRVHGPGSEQCAFGSFLYNLTRGVEPYEDMGPEIFDLWKNKVFPELSDSRLDVLTLRCWSGEFASMAEIAAEVATLEGAKSAATTTATDYEYMSKMKATCEELLRTKLSDLGQEFPQYVREDNNTT